MSFLGLAPIFLLLALLGAALFSAAAGFCIYPSIKKEVFKLIAAKGSEPGDDESENTLRRLRRLYVSRRISAMAGRRALSGWLFLPARQEAGASRVLVIAPEGRAVSIKDLRCFLERGFLVRAAHGGALPAVFIPKPAELCKAGFFFSFGKKEAAALAACGRYLSLKFPQSSILFCGKGLGAFSAILAGKRGDFGGVIADLPASSIAAVMRRVAARLFPQRAPRVLVYAGARLASVFCGLGIGGRGCRRALKRLAALKKSRPGLAVEIRYKRRKHFRAK